MSNILDSLVAGIMLFVFAVVVLLAAFVMNTVLNSMGDDLGLNASFGNFFVALNNVSIFIFLGMSLGVILAALMIRTHPAFFFIAVILVIVQFTVFPPLVNVYNTIADNPQFAAEKATMAQNVALMQALPIWTAFAALIAAVVGLGRGK